MKTHQNIRLTARDIVKNCIRLECRKQSVVGVVRAIKDGGTFREGVTYVTGKLLRVFEISTGQWEVDYGSI